MLDVVRMRVEMARVNMTQGELAEATGISRQSVNAYLAQRYKPTPENVRKLADALNVAPAHLDATIQTDRRPEELAA